MNAYYGGMCVLIALTLLVGTSSFARTRRWLTAETSRKVVHVGMGIVCLAFPVLFTSVGAVLVLAILAAAALALVRVVPKLRQCVGCAIADVNRQSYGEFAFIAGIAAAFAFTRGNDLAYVVPVAVLTFADTAAAIVGQYFGWHRFRIADASKSLEGSAAFFAAAVAVVAVPLLILGIHAAIPIAVFVGMLLMVVEAISSAGLDNLAIPVVGALLVRGFTGTISGGM